MPIRKKKVVRRKPRGRPPVTPQARRSRIDGRVKLLETQVAELQEQVASLTGFIRGEIALIKEHLHWLSVPDKVVEAQPPQPAPISRDGPSVETNDDLPT
jgi:hypothetical protein